MSENAAGTSTGVPTPRARVLVLWSHESSPNLGVAVLARGSRDLIRRAMPGADITFTNYGNRPPEIPWGSPRSLLRERVQSRVGMQKYFAGFDLVWDTRSGDSFADIYGFERLLTMGLVHEFASQADVPVLMAPQTIGPFRSRRARLLGRRTLRRSEYVVARDPISAQAAEQLGRPADAVTADLVFGIDQPAVTEHRDVLLNVSGLLWQTNPHVDASTYREVVRDLVARLRAEGREVALLAHVLDSPVSDNDVLAVRSLAADLPSDIEIVVPEGLDHARSIIAGAELVIGSRMHACLNALSVGVPAIPLAYSRKFAPLMESVGWTEIFDLRTERPSDLGGQVVDAAARVTASDAKAAAERGRESLTAVIAHLRELA